MRVSGRMKSHLPMIVAGPRDSSAWNLASIRRLRGQDSSTNIRQILWEDSRAARAPDICPLCAKLPSRQSSRTGGVHGAGLVWKNTSLAWRRDGGCKEESDRKAAQPTGPPIGTVVTSAPRQLGSRRAITVQHVRQTQTASVSTCGKVAEPLNTLQLTGCTRSRECVPEFQIPV